MKNVLLLVHDDLGQEARLQVALDMTRALGGHLHCLDVALMPLMACCPYDGVGMGMLLEDEVDRESINKTTLEARLAKEDVAWSWTDCTDTFEDALRSAASLADVIVVNRKLTNFPVPDMRRTASDLIVHAHRPILAVPEEAKGLDLFGCALIAWDGSPSASAAMIAAVPLLQLAKSVVLFEIDDRSVETHAEEAAAYLARYDIHPRIVHDQPVGQTAGELILLATAAQKANWIVMGGYGHSRVSEAIFGGATRTMLTKSNVPVFLAH